MSAVPIKVSEILGLLKAGKTRDEIAEMYNLNGVQLKELFKHPKLKNKKTVKEKGVPFILVDDTEGDMVEDAVKADVTEEVAAKVEETEAPVEVAEEAVVEQPAEVQITDEATAEQVAPTEQSEGPLWGND